MGWIIFFGVSCLLFVVFVPFKNWKRLWSAGTLTMILLYLIDSTLIRLDAFSYSYGNSILSGLPTFYWLGSFFGGIILAYFYPENHKWQFPYLIFMAGIFLLMELIMYWGGYFHYNKWSPVNSYFLDFIGFTSVLWMAQHLGAIGKRE